MRGAPPRLRTPALLLVAGLLLGVAAAAGAALLAWKGREAALAEAGRELRNMALVLGEHTDRSLQSVEILQSALIARMRAEGVATAEEYRAWAASRAVHDLLRDRTRGLPQLDAITMVGADGTLLNFSRTWPIPPVNLADRAYFREIREGVEGVVSEPVRNRGSGTWTIYLARRVSGPSGEFLGMVLGAVELDYFERFYGSLAMREGSSFTLARQDGLILARHPRAEAMIGRSLTGAEQFRLFSANLGGPAMRVTSILDGQDRLVAGWKLEHFPLLVAVTDTMEAALAGWRKQAAWLATGTALLLLLVAGGIAAAARQVRAQAATDAARAEGAEAAERAAQEARSAAEARARLAEEQRRRARELAERDAEFRTAVEGMGLGLWKFCPEGRLTLTNRRCAEIIGFPPEALRAGASFAELRTAAARAGGGGAAVMARLAPLVALRKPGSFVCDLEGDRAASVGFRPLADGGWLATFEDVTERRRAEARVEHMARHDALTGLPNRTLFRERLDATLAAAATGTGAAVAVLYLDLDHFKAVNDTLGHPVGDALLRAATGRLRGRMREGDMLARLGGDEFAVVMAEDADQPAAAAALAGRLIEALSEPFVVEGHQVVVGTSVGIALSPTDGGDADALLRNADLALYRSKQDGRGRCRFFEPGMDARVQRRRRLELDLRRALAAREFALHYQPIVEARSRRLVGFEALLRWRHPQRGMVPPADFVPLAEEIGLIAPLGEFVLRRACAEAATWPAPLRVAVNLSPAQFRSSGLAECVTAALAEGGLDPRRLELEITEGVLLQDGEATIAVLRRLRSLGVRIAMDDFGTGWSSLGYLRSFPFDKVKIDRSFVQDLEARQDDAAIVQAVTGLCARLGMATTAEGVETEEQLRRLVQERCTEAQGYLFSPPCPAEEIPALIARLGIETGQGEAPAAAAA